MAHVAMRHIALNHSNAKLVLNVHTVHRTSAATLLPKELNWRTNLQQRHLSQEQQQRLQRTLQIFNLMGTDDRSLILSSIPNHTLLMARVFDTYRTGYDE